ncbi:MAG: hypothetical protein ACJ764_06675 [Solirubrobacteraceae bacterium]
MRPLAFLMERMSYCYVWGPTTGAAFAGSDTCGSLSDRSSTSSVRLPRSQADLVAAGCSLLGRREGEKLLLVGAITARSSVSMRQSDRNSG